MNDLITRRVAVDLPAEDDRIRRALRMAERLLTEASRLVVARGCAEVAATRTTEAGKWVADSPRSVCLQLAQDNIGWAREQLQQALLASGTMTDEPPF